MKLKKQLKESVFFVAAIGLSIFMLFFVITCTWIGFDAKNHCREAKNDYGGDCVEALIALLSDENRSFHSRNSAIWALGQLGDRRAYPVLQKYYTGIIPEREPYNDGISQYELKKAVSLTNGGLNITAVFWRYGLSNSSQ